MFTARTVVVIVALGAGGIAASSATAMLVARPAIADEPIPTIQPAPAAMACVPFACRVTAQK